MPTVQLQRWGEDDLETLRRSNAPEMMTYLGGPETDAKLLERNDRYLRFNREGTAHMFRIVTAEHPEGVGVIGYWFHDHDGVPSYETGWSVESAYQGQGIATAALLEIIEHARVVRGRRELHAYPRTDNLASNAICRKAGFTNRGEIGHEYPPGNPIRCHDWVFEL